jgi:hypothetical protein
MKIIAGTATENLRIRLARLDTLKPTTLIGYGTAIFTLLIALAYVLYPHWVTLSGFVHHWYTLIPFVLAMLIAILELWYVGTGLYRHVRLRTSAVLLYASAISACLILCIPYTASALEKDVHDAIAMLFVVLAASGFISIATNLRHHLVGVLGGLMFGLCILEAVFLARYQAHPVYSWVWTVMELAGIATMMVALYIIGGMIESNFKPR